MIGCLHFLVGSKRSRGRIVGGEVPHSACLTEGVGGQKLFGPTFKKVPPWDVLTEDITSFKMSQGYHIHQHHHHHHSSPFLVFTRYPDLGDGIPWGGGAAISVQWSKMRPGHSAESLLSETASPQKWTVCKCLDWLKLVKQAWFRGWLGHG